jgi:D-sedoheptulose 7-phosphate isomerase
MLDDIRRALEDAATALTALQTNDEALQSIDRAGSLLADAFRQGYRVFSCGNGGSMCDAMHFAEELSGRFREDRAALPATAISDPGHLSCVANDYGYEEVFARYVQAHGKAGDVLLGISTSGASANVVRACEQARELGMQTVVLTGRVGSKLAEMADVAIVTAAGAYADRVQELHIKVVHILIECVERRLFEPNYRS